MTVEQAFSGSPLVDRQWLASGWPPMAGLHKLLRIPRIPTSQDALPISSWVAHFLPLPESLPLGPPLPLRLDLQNLCFAWQISSMLFQIDSAVYMLMHHCFSFNRKTKTKIAAEIKQTHVKFLCDWMHFNAYYVTWGGFCPGARACTHERLGWHSPTDIVHATCYANSIYNFFLTNCHDAEQCKNSAFLVEGFSGPSGPASCISCIYLYIFVYIWIYFDTCWYILIHFDIFGIELVSNWYSINI